MPFKCEDCQHKNVCSFVSNMVQLTNDMEKVNMELPKILHVRITCSEYIKTVPISR